MRVVILLIMCVMCTLLPSVGDATAQGRPGVTIGIVIDGDSPRYGYIKGIITNELSDLLAGDYDVRLPDEKIIVADWTLAGVDRAISQLIGDSDVDVVVCIGAVSARAAANRTSFPKPLVALPAFGADLQALPRDGRGSGVRNFHYLAFPKHDDLAALHDVTEFSNLAVMIDGAFMDALPDASEYITRVSSDFDETPQVVRFDGDVSATLAALDTNIDAVWVFPLLRMNQADFDKLVIHGAHE